jgi:APA family basic amino acid/polyamine antiporter
MNTPSEARPAPGIGLWICTALVVGNMIGSGVFLLPSSLAPFGGISMVGWVVSAAGAVCLALVFARLGRFLPRLGGPYAYAHYGFGEFGGFLVAWAYWISMWTTNAALAVAFISYSTVFWPTLATTPALAAGTAIGSLWLLTVVNAAGVRTAGIVQLVTTILKLLPLIAIATLGLLYFNADHFVPFNPSGQTTFGAVAATVTLTLWAFLGLESGTVPAADVRDPERTIPRATIMGTLIAATVYILGTAAVMGIIAPTTLASSTAPYADAAHSIWGSWGRYLLGAGATISCFGCLNGWILLSGQLPRAAALDGLLPAAFSRLSGRGTPVFGLVISSAIATVLIFMNYTRGLVGAFTFLILLATLATLVPYVFSSMTELLVAVRQGFTGGLRRVLGPAAVAVAAFIYSVVAVIGSGRDAVYWGFVLILVGLPIYVVMISRRRSAT